MALPDMISVEDFFAPPVRIGATISPDGTRIAYLAPWKNRLNVWVQPVGSDEQARCVTADETRTVLNYEWTDDPRWMLYLQDNGGDENWHVYRVDLDDPDAPAVDLTPFPGAKAFIELPGGLPGKAIVYLNKRNVERMDAYELDIATGELTLLAENPGKVAGWLSSRNGDLFAMALTPGGDVELLRWDTATHELRSIAIYDGADYTMGIFPMVITPDGTGIWVGPTRARTGRESFGWMWPPASRLLSTVTRHSIWTHGARSGRRSRSRSSSAGGRGSCSGCAISVSDRRSGHWIHTSPMSWPTWKS
jgi:dipeptidyl aminopeptidase/acylaminoacyl peptidase